jgi:glucosamine kinase
MELIADSGSTKTVWALIEQGKLIKTIQTAGLNPYFHTSDSIELVIKNELTPFLDANSISAIHFYGAGCSTEKNNNLLKEIMRGTFTTSGINIYHDILGAARALFGKEPGIAGILGTGCNSCFYDGKDIISAVPSLGYLFGDEGAGSYLGKRFMEKQLKNQLPAEIQQAFDERYKISLEDVLNALYNQPFPNRFLASFSEFIEPLQHHPFIREMIKASFNTFFNEHILKYENCRLVPVSFVGSVAYFYKEILMESTQEHNINVGSIVRSPLEGLIRFHCG